MKHKILLLLLLLGPVGCRDDPPHPNQQQLDLAEKHAQQAVEQADKARAGSLSTWSD